MIDLDVGDLVSLAAMYDEPESLFIVERVGKSASTCRDVARNGLVKIANPRLRVILKRFRLLFPSYP